MMSWSSTDVLELIIVMMDGSANSQILRPKGEQAKGRVLALGCQVEILGNSKDLDRSSPTRIRLADPSEDKNSIVCRWSFEKPRL